jgi:AraC-like DNA-binding protein
MENNVRRHHLLHQYPRLTKGVPYLYAIGWISHKTEWIKTIFDTTNFSFIFRGKGISNFNNSQFDLTPPIVLLEKEGEKYHYGPHAMWEEIYLMYKAPVEGLLDRWNLSPAQGHTWPMGGLSKIKTYTRMMETLVQMPGLPGAADKLDRLAEMVILESLWGEPAQTMTHEEMRIHEAERYIRENYSKSINLEELAAKNGFSLPTFRRYWNRQFKYTPMSLLNTLRLERAHQLLLETKNDISSIAYEIGYNDPMYFSKKFRAHYHTSPSKFREAT